MKPFTVTYDADLLSNGQMQQILYDPAVRVMGWCHAFYERDDLEVEVFNLKKQNQQVNKSTPHVVIDDMVESVREAVSVYVRDSLGREESEEVIRTALESAIAEDKKLKPHRGPVCFVDDGMIERALKQYHGGSKWHVDLWTEMRKTIEVALNGDHK